MWEMSSLCNISALVLSCRFVSMFCLSLHVSYSSTVQQIVCYWQLKKITFQEAEVWNLFCNRIKSINLWWNGYFFNSHSFFYCILLLICYIKAFWKQNNETTLVRSLVWKCHQTKQNTNIFIHFVFSTPVSACVPFIDDP